jgi:hypothetical protein
MTISTARLTLDRLSVVDFDAMWAIHADPLTNEFNPAGPLAKRMDAQRLFGEWLGQWHEHGFGYWTVRDESGVIGFSGLRYSTWNDRTVLNLAYRYTPRAWTRLRDRGGDGRRRPLACGALGASAHRLHEAGQRGLAAHGARRGARAASRPRPGDGGCAG